MDIIPPQNKMPIPNQYFFIVVGGKGLKQFIPAISQCYCSADEFYNYCKVLNKDGSIASVKYGNFYFGWAEMFPNTKTYKIINV